MQLIQNMARSCSSAALVLPLLALTDRVADRTFTGATRLSRSTNWQDKAITFDDQSVIVIKGSRPTLENTAKITLEGAPKTL